MSNSKLPKDCYFLSQRNLRICTQWATVPLPGSLHLATKATHTQPGCAKRYLQRSTGHRGIPSILNGSGGQPAGLAAIKRVYRGI